MKVRIIGHRDVVDLLPMAECIDVMEAMFRASGKKQSVLPPRQVMWQPDGLGALGLMPCWLGVPPALGAKVVSVFPGNSRSRHDAHQGVILLFETRNGCLQAIVDAGAVTAIRTAAVSGLATRILARGDACDLAILGAGTQAATHLAAMVAVRPVARVRVWNRDPERARRFATAMSARHGVPVTAVATVRDAVADADLVCTVTGATRPLLEGSWLAPGMHVNAAGASVTGFRELDTAAMLRSRVFVDSREAALRDADDIRVPLHESAIDEGHILGALPDLVAGPIRGRTQPEDITVFKSVGLATEDLAAACHVVEKAGTMGAGTLLEFGAGRLSAWADADPPA